jgi:hypothetical protein
MVLLHALGEQATNWQDVAPRFASKFRVVIGNGRTTAVFSLQSPEH